MILQFCHDIITEGGVVGNAVFGTGEIEDIAISGEPPVAPPADVKTEIPAEFIAQPGRFGIGIPHRVVKIGRIITAERHQGNTARRVETAAGYHANAPVRFAQLIIAN